MTTAMKRKVGLFVTVALACLLALALPAGASGARSTSAGSAAQTCDPTYGCTTTSTPPASQIQCHFTITRGPVGTRVSVVCTGVAPGVTVRVFFDHIQVALGQLLAGDAPNGVNGAAAAPAVAFGRAAVPDHAAQTTGMTHITFDVPAIALRTYNGLISGQSFSKNLGPFEVIGALSAASSPSSSSGSLAHTGATILLWVVVALALLFAGYVLYRRSRRPARR